MKAKAVVKEVFKKVLSRFLKKDKGPLKLLI